MDETQREFLLLYVQIIEPQVRKPVIMQFPQLIVKSQLTNNAYEALLT